MTGQGLKVAIGSFDKRLNKQRKVERGEITFNRKRKGTGDTIEKVARQGSQYCGCCLTRDMMSVFLEKTNVWEMTEGFQESTSGVRNLTGVVKSY